MLENQSAPGRMPAEFARYPDRVVTDIQSNHGRVQTKSLPEIMADEVGQYVVCQMLIGTNKMVVFEGVLTQVGSNYFVLFDESTNSLTSCDMYSLKFVTFFSMGMPTARYEAVPDDVRHVEDDVCKWYEPVTGSNGFRYVPLDDATIGGSMPKRLREEGAFAPNQL